MKCCCAKGNAATTSVLIASLVPILVISMSDREPEAAGVAAEAQPVIRSEQADHHPADVLHYVMNRIDGEPEELEIYRGKVVLMVNVASKCGLTPQYEALEELYQRYKDEGFVVIGFPANDFRGQEPGTNEEIAQFCSLEYGVTFPMFEKIVVTGENKHPLYKQLEELPEPLGGEPRWNFTKFLIDESGHVVERFEPRVAPDDPRVTVAIDHLLGREEHTGSIPASPGG